MKSPTATTSKPLATTKPMKYILIILTLIIVWQIINTKRNNSKYEVEENSIDTITLPESEPYEWKDYNPITLKEFKNAFEEENMLDEWAYFKKHLKPEIRITPSQINEELLKIGQSKIGGHPDLPESIQWPKDRNEKKLAFLAQINFEDLITEEIEIPSFGILYFFYDEAQEFWGESKNKSDLFRVIYTKNTKNLSRKQSPTNFTLLKDGTYKACKLKFTNSYSLPNWEYPYVRKNLNKTNEDAYIDISSSGQMNTKLFGHSTNIQGRMEFECEMVEQGYNWKNIPNTKKTEIENNSDKWKLLFQIDSEQQAGMMWGDVGRIYFWIKEKDLKAEDYEKAWMIFQCH